MFTPYNLQFWDRDIPNSPPLLTMEVLSFNLKTGDTIELCVTVPDVSREYWELDDIPLVKYVVTDVRQTFLKDYPRSGYNIKDTIYVNIDVIKK